MEALQFHQVECDQQKAQAGGLIREYLDWLNECFLRDYDLQFDAEAMVQSDLSDADKFHPPHGRFYLAQVGEQVVGVGCLKKLTKEEAEIQRMYVSKSFRGKGFGRAIAGRLIEDARTIGYRKLKLESLEFLDAAHALYRSIGFHDIDPYADNSMESYQPPEQLNKYYAITVFMEMDI